MFSEGNDARTGEDAEDVTLVVGEFCRTVALVSRSRKQRQGKGRRTSGRLSAEFSQFVSKEGVNAGQTEVSETGTVAEERVDALTCPWLVTSDLMTMLRPKVTHLDRKMHAIAEMHALKAAGAQGDPGWAHQSRRRQGQDASIRDRLTLDQADPPQLRQRRQLLDGGIGQSVAAGQVDVPNPIAALDELHDREIGDVGAMAQVDVMQVLAQLRDGKDRLVGDLLAFGQH